MVMPAKSDELHKLNGTKPEVVSERPSSIAGGRPRVPSELSPEATKEFKKLCAALRKRRALTPGDASILRLWAILYDRHNQALAELASGGLVCEYMRLNSNGESVATFKQNLYLKIAENCEGRMMAILDRLGLTPAHRDRVRPTKPKAAPKVLSPEEEFMQRLSNNSQPQPEPEEMMIEEETSNDDARG
jgi:P27 family predicted phage terminase small subunit